MPPWRIWKTAFTRLKAQRAPKQSKLLRPIKPITRASCWTQPRSSWTSNWPPPKPRPPSISRWICPPRPCRRPWLRPLPRLRPRRPLKVRSDEHAGRKFYLPSGGVAGSAAALGGGRGGGVSVSDALGGRHLRCTGSAHDAGPARRHQDDRHGRHHALLRAHESHPDGGLRAGPAG